MWTYVWCLTIVYSLVFAMQHGLSVLGLCCYGNQLFSCSSHLSWQPNPSQLHWLMALAQILNTKSSAKTLLHVRISHCYNQCLSICGSLSTHQCTATTSMPVWLQFWDFTTFVPSVSHTFNKCHFQKREQVSELVLIVYASGPIHHKCPTLFSPCGKPV